MGKDNIILNADQLGSGVHNLFKYSKYYSGKEPEFVEGDVFKIIVPLDDKYSFDFKLLNDDVQSADKVPISADKMPISVNGILIDNLSLQQKLIVQCIVDNGQITSCQAETVVNVKQRRARAILKELVNQGILEQQGAYKSTVYKLNCTKKDISQKQ